MNVGKELAALRRMSVDGLRSRYAEVFGETTNGRHKDWLIKRIIYRLQVLAEGDLSERARQRAAELANDADLRRKPPKSATTKPETPSRTATATLRTNADSRVPLPGTTIIHHGRHTFVSHALAGGRTLAEVRDAAGHCNVSITSIYLHLAVDDEGQVGNLFAYGAL